MKNKKMLIADTDKAFRRGAAILTKVTLNTLLMQVGKSQKIYITSKRRYCDPDIMDTKEFGEFLDEYAADYDERNKKWVFLDFKDFVECCVVYADKTIEIKRRILQNLDRVFTVGLDEKGKIVTCFGLEVQRRLNVDLSNLNEVLSEESEKIFRHR